MTDPEPVSTRTEGPTPMGGAWSVTEFFDEDHQPVPRSKASRVRITEYAFDGSVLHVASGRIDT